MSLLLRSQTPVVATGLEEAPSPVLAAVLAGVVLLGSVGEDFGGAHPTEEVAIAATIADVAVITTTSRDEEFGPAVAAVGEEESASVFTPILTALVGLSIPEDFAGSLPLEEATSPWLTSAPPTWISASDLGEEFGLPHPNEEAASVLPLVYVTALALVAPPEDFAGSLPIEEATDEVSPLVFVSLPILATPIVVPEDFAGSLPLEEPPGFVWIDTPPVWLTVTFDEDFGLPHPIEETSSIAVGIIDVALSIPPPPEDFAGSLPAEEAPDETFSFVFIAPDLPWPQATAVEDFAGSLPLEETSSLWLPPETAWISVTFFDEEFGGAHPSEEEFQAQFVADIPPLIIAPPPEDFAGSLPIEEPVDEAALFVFVQPFPQTTPLVVPEDFAGSLPLEEPPGLLPPVFRPSVPWLFNEDEILPEPPPPPPPPPPPRPPPPSRHIRAVGGSGAIQIERPWCPPGYHYVWDKYHWVCVPQTTKVEADYAILPLVDDVTVKALVDGTVETFKDKNGNLVVRLTADDGTTYFYAKVQKVKVGRVKRGDVIGVSAGAAIAPKALPPASTGAHQPPPSTPQEPKGVFGVLPVAPLPKPPAVPPALPRPPARLPATQQMQATMRHAPPSVGSTIIVGIGIVGAAIVVAAMIRSIRKKPSKKKKRKRRRRR